MDDTGNRAIDILIAQKLGFYVKHGTLYTPRGTLLGGDVRANMGMYELEDNTDIWQNYTPRFTKNVDDAIWLTKQIQPVYFQLSYSPDRMNWRAEFAFDYRNDIFVDAKEPAEAISLAFMEWHASTPNRDTAD